MSPPRDRARARVDFGAPPGTYFDSGSFNYDIGAYNLACNGGNPCWYADIHIGPWLQEGQGSIPRAAAHSWSNCSFWCTGFRINVGCPWSYCFHRADPNDCDWYYDYVAIKDINVTVIDPDGPSLSLGGSLFDNQVAHGTPGMRIDASDRGSGVETVTVGRERGPGRDPADVLSGAGGGPRDPVPTLRQLPPDGRHGHDEDSLARRAEHAEGLRRRRGDRAGSGESGLRAADGLGR